MPGYALFDAFSDLTVSRPGKPKVVEQLLKFVVVHVRALIRAPEKINSTVLLVYLSVFCVASKNTYNQYALFDAL